MATVFTQNSQSKFRCDNCDYGCSSQSRWQQHILTSKHEKATKCYINATEKYACECGKSFKHHSSYYRHKKTCIAPESTDIINELVKSNQEFKQIIVDQNKNNQELQHQVIELCKSGINNVNSHNSTNTNSHNKSFNLNMFLNETCKDAMNMNEFVDSIIITVSDLEGMGKLGFVNGLSNIIIKNLKAIDYRLRPVHCTDTKRDTVYTKEKDKGVKECEDHINVRRFIQLVAKKNTGNIKLFRNKYPDCLDSRSRSSDVYNKIVMETYGGYGNNDHDSEDKIIRKLVKEIAVYKADAL